MDDKLVGVDSLGLHYSREYLTPPAVDVNPPDTISKGKLSGTTGKVMEIIITKIPKKEKSLQYLLRVNNSGRHFHWSGITNGHGRCHKKLMEQLGNSSL